MGLLAKIKALLGRGSGQAVRYAAARPDRTHYNWRPIDQNVNDLIGRASPLIRAQVRQLTRDFPAFAAAVRVLTDCVVGTGIRFQADTRRGDQRNETLNRQIEDARRAWANEADITGKLHLDEMQRLARRQELESGEYLIVRVFDKTPGRYLPLALQMFEADWLTDFGVRPAAGNEVEQGIEYDKSSGRPVAYHFADPDSMGKPRRVRAENVIHGFDLQRPGQLRGISPFTSAILLAHSLEDYMGATMDVAREAARTLAFVTTPNPGQHQKGRITKTTEDGKSVEETLNAVKEYLLPGEDIKFADPKRPSSEFEPFVKFILRLVGTSVGVPYELLSGDYKDISYASARIIRLDAEQGFRPIKDRIIKQQCRTMHRWFMDALALSGRVHLPGYWNNPAPYMRASFTPPGMEYMDQLRESTANEKDQRMLTRSPQEIIRRRGRDPEDVLDETKDFYKMAAKRGLVPMFSGGGGLHTNPAALGANE